MNVNYLTGYAAITPWGNEDATYSFENKTLDTTRLIPKINPKSKGWNGMNRFSRSTQLCTMAIGEALKNAGISVPFAKDSLDSVRTGLIIGTTFSYIESINDLENDSLRYGVNNINPSIFPNTVLNAVGGYASIYFNIKGPNITISSGDISGPKALLYATDLLNKRELDRVVVCQCNVIPPSKYESSCEFEYNFESVISYVIEGGNKIKPTPDVSRLELGYESSGKCHLEPINPTNFLMAILNNDRKLRKYNMLQTKAMCNLGDEGSIILSLTRGG